MEFNIINKINIIDFQNKEFRLIDINLTIKFTKNSCN